MNQVPIDVAQIEIHGLPRKSFPGCTRFRIVMSRQAHESIWKHCGESLSTQDSPDCDIKEVGGVLVGNMYRDSHGPFLEVTASIAGKHTRNEGTQVTFTPETWAYVNSTKEEMYPDARVVGWYHTHPRFGIFLSERDRFIQRHSFPQPWATAFVVDPVQQTEGFFIWSEGETRLAEEYWVGQERRDRSFAGQQEHQVNPASTTRSLPERKPTSAVSRAGFALTAAMGFLGMLLLFGYVYVREVAHSETEKFMVRALEGQKSELVAAYRALDVLRTELEMSRKQSKAANMQVQQQIRRLNAGLKRVAELATVLQERITAQQQILERIPPAVPGSQLEVK